MLFFLFFKNRTLYKQSLQEIKEEQDRMLYDQKSQIYVIYSEPTEKNSLVLKEEETLSILSEVYLIFFFFPNKKLKMKIKFIEENIQRWS